MVRSSLFSLIIVLVCFGIYILFPHLSAIASVGLLLSLFPYYISIWQGLRKKQIDLSLPSVATIYLLLFLGKANIAIIYILIILLGNLFKSVILERIKSSITSISKKLPKTAHIKRGSEDREILISDIKIDDLLLVKSGDRVATDACLMTDRATLDESVVTGESRPISKVHGDNLYAGSVNVGDYFEAKAISDSESSTLFQIQKLVTEAQNDKPPLAYAVSRYAWITTMAALLGVIIIYLLTQNILQALSFWIAVVPVIFAIIVPVATTIGIALLAKQGILVKNSTSLEHLTKAPIFFFDKTGTITYGEPRIGEIIELNGSRKEILQLAASLESYSNHPLAIPILEEAKKQNVEIIPLKDVETHVGQGITAFKDTTKVCLGNLELLRAEKISLDQDTEKLVANWEEKGATPVFVGQNNKAIAVIILVDSLRVETRKLFVDLNDSGYKTIVLTGDKQEVAESIVKGLPYTQVIANLLPTGKLEEMEKKIKAGKTTVMVGDGINDAPVLAKADVGIAMGGRGVDLAINAADIVLLNNNIASISSIIGLSKKIFQIIKQDVLLATVIHVITASFVLVGAVSLVQTTIIHEISSALVLLNILRIFYLQEAIPNKTP